MTIADLISLLKSYTAELAASDSRLERLYLLDAVEQTAANLRQALTETA